MFTFPLDFINRAPRCRAKCSPVSVDTFPGAGQFAPRCRTYRPEKLGKVNSSFLITDIKDNI